MNKDNNSQRNYFSKNFFENPQFSSLKAIRVTLSGSWILSPN